MKRRMRLNDLSMLIGWIILGRSSYGDSLLRVYVL
jgi:hypothetical protein